MQKLFSLSESKNRGTRPRFFGLCCAKSILCALPRGSRLGGRDGRRRGDIGAFRKKLRIFEKKSLTSGARDDIIYRQSELRYAPVAQLDRVFGYEPKGRGFESLLAYQINRLFLLK